MDLNDSFTDKFLKRRKARKDYLKFKMLDSPARKKRTALIEEKQIPCEDDLNKKKESEAIQQVNKPLTSVFSTNNRELGSIRNRLKRLAADFNDWEDNLTRSSVKATSSAKEISAAAAYNEVEDTSNRSFDPSNLPLSARKAIFEQASLENKAQSEKQIFKPKMSVARRAAMFENAPENKFRFGTVHHKPANASPFKPLVKVGSQVKTATALGPQNPSSVRIGSPTRPCAALAGSPVKPLIASTGSLAKSYSFNCDSSAKTSVFSSDSPAKSSTFSRDSPVTSSTFSRDSPVTSSTFSRDSPAKLSTFTQGSLVTSSTFSRDSNAKSSAFSRDCPAKSSAFSRGSSATSSAFSRDTPAKSSAFSRESPAKSSAFSRDSSATSSTFNRNSPSKSSTFSRDSPTKSGRTTTTSSKSFIPKPTVIPSQRQWSNTAGIQPEEKLSLCRLVDHWEKLSSSSSSMKSQSEEVAKNWQSRLNERFKHARI